MANLPAGLRKMLGADGAPPAKRPKAAPAAGVGGGYFDASLAMQAAFMTSGLTANPGFMNPGAAAGAARPPTMNAGIMPGSIPGLPNRAMMGGAGMAQTAPTMSAPARMAHGNPGPRAAGALGSASSASAAPVPEWHGKRTVEELKEALNSIGVSEHSADGKLGYAKVEEERQSRAHRRDLTVRELEVLLLQSEAEIRRCEKTKNMVRHQDQRLLACFTEGLSPPPGAYMKMLEEGADPNTVSTGPGSGFAAGMTPLLAACSWGKLEEVRLLIAAGADLYAKTPNVGRTVIHVVAGGSTKSWGRERTMLLVKLLVNKAPNLMKVKDEMGKTPLDVAKYEKQRDCVAFLTSMAASLGM